MPAQGEASRSDVCPPQHLRRRLVELLGAPDLFETRQQVLWAHALLLGTMEVVQHLAFVHHDQPIAERRDVHGADAAGRDDAADTGDGIPVFRPPIGDMIKKRQAEILAAEKAVGEIT